MVVLPRQLSDYGRTGSGTPLTDYVKQQLIGQAHQRMIRRDEFHFPSPAHDRQRNFGGTGCDETQKEEKKRFHFRLCK